MYFNFHSLPIESIDFRDTTFQITTKDTVGDLRASIQKLGVMQLPVLCEIDSKMLIISGFRRIHACRQLGFEKISVNLVTPKTPQLRLALMAIADNASQRPLNLIEMSRAFNLLSRHMTDPADMSTVLSGLGLPESTDFIEKVKSLDGMAPDIQQGLIENSISLPIALELGKYETNEGGVLAKLFRQFHLSLNKQREVLGLLADIAGRDGDSITEILKHQQIVDIMQSGELDRNQKVNQLRRYLKQCRYPELCRLEEQFTAMVTRLGLGQGLKLKPPLNFEGSDYTLSITFRSQQELLQRLTRAQSRLFDPEFKKFIDQ